MFDSAFLLGVGGSMMYHGPANRMSPILRKRWAPSDARRLTARQIGFGISCLERQSFESSVSQEATAERESLVRDNATEITRHSEGSAYQGAPIFSVDQTL